MISNDIKEIKLWYGKPPVANFALEIFLQHGVHWDHCLEMFAAKFTSNTLGFFFSHPENKANDIACFINKIESILNTNFSYFSKTSVENIVWIKPSEFWKNCLIKRSLFLILLRTSFNYDFIKDNLKDTLFGPYEENKYIKETKNAFLRFLFGFTIFDGSLPNIPSNSSVIKHGWHEEFVNSSIDNIKIKLIDNKNNNYLGKNLLWI